MVGSMSWVAVAVVVVMVAVEMSAMLTLSVIDRIGLEPGRKAQIEDAELERGRRERESSKQSKKIKRKRRFNSGAGNLIPHWSGCVVYRSRLCWGQIASSPPTTPLMVMYMQYSVK